MHNFRQASSKPEAKMYSNNILPMWFTTPLLLVFVLLLVMMNKKIKTLPPGPPKLPIIGNMIQLRGGLHHRTLLQLAKKYGPVMHVNLGGVPIVVISSAEAAEKVLKTYEAHCCRRPLLLGSQTTSYNYSDLSFSPYNDYYKKIRKMSNIELFSAQRMHSFSYIREEEVAFLVDTISQCCSSATPVDLREELLFLTSNVTCRIAFGKSVQDSEFNYKAAIEALQMIEEVAASDFFPFVGWIISKLKQLDKKSQRVFHELDSFYQKLIVDRLTNGPMQNQEHRCIIDVLLQLQRNQSHDVQLTNENIKAFLKDVLLGGSHTSVINMIWAMTELVKNPTLMKKVQEEIRNCVGKKGRVSESDVENLQYLKAVVKETFRLHPSVTVYPREAISEFNIDGYMIYPKTHIMISNWAIARDPKIWEKPEEFIPERFLYSSIDMKGHHFELIPFGSGRRICPGMHLAINIIELTLANLLCCFDWKLPGGMKVEDISAEEETAFKLVPIKHI